MADIMFKGKVTFVGETQTYKTGASGRTFWATELQNGDKKFPNELEFSVFTSAKGPNQFRAGSEDLDNIHVGNIVSFAYEPRGSKWEPKDGRPAKLFNKLQLTSKITIMGDGNTRGNGGRRGSVPPPAEPVQIEDVPTEDMPF